MSVRRDSKSSRPY
ncbi:hypothetical protein MTR67_013049 [Solanum verrucosum]|uniref:Uncharacterized protein n=1 Tax=Solanum verrucosum TaxID=315347 RepID=A0AAF0Q9R6_SOLVR|nr:hypothetical protein MTR67_013049 [Solanum verrucosum]